MAEWWSIFASFVGGNRGDGPGGGGSPDRVPKWSANTPPIFLYSADCPPAEDFFV